MGQSPFQDAPLNAEQAKAASFVDAPLADFKTTNEAPSPSMWEQANTPLIPHIQQAAHAISDFLSQPRQGDQELNDHIKGLGTASAMLRGGAAGMVEGAGNVLAGFTSPVGVALMLSGLAGDSAIVKQIPALKTLLELPAVKGLQRAVQAGAGAGFTAHGVGQVATAPTIAGKAQGVVEAATGALGMASALPRPAMPNLAKNIDPQMAEAVRAGQAAGVPVDLATATGSRAIRSVQDIADHSLGGSMVAETARQQRGKAMEQWRDPLVAQTNARAEPQASGAQSPEVAGQGVVGALEKKQKGHASDAASHYWFIDRASELPEAQSERPLPPSAVDAQHSGIKGQLRRIVHEMDASGYTGSKLLADENGGSGTTYVHRTGGAAVFHDITERLGYEPTRAQVQSELEAYLGGGKETAVVKAALNVAQDRYVGKLNGISTPELPPSEMQTPTRLERSRVTTQTVAYPVDTAALKPVLKPLLAKILELMPLAQEQQSVGIKALRNIIEGPDVMPLTQADQNLSAIKKLVRDSQNPGVAKIALAKLHGAVDVAAATGGPEIVEALQRGREATKAAHATQDVIDTLPGGHRQEPVAVTRQATASGDTKIEFLRELKREVPEHIPAIARARLEDLIAMSPDKAAAEWNKLGPSTRAILFPDMGHAQALDHFFRLNKALAFNVNPSGSGRQAVMAGQLAALGGSVAAGPIPLFTALGLEGTAATAAAMMHSPSVVRALTQAASVVKQPAASGAARAAALASLSSAVRRAGLPALVPALGQDESRLATGAPRK